MSAIELLYSAALETTSEQITVINAHANPLLNQLCSSRNCSIQQHFKPAYDELIRSGLTATTSLQIHPECELVLILPAKNRQQTLSWMALAISHLKDGGKIIVSSANNHGAKSYEAALKKLAGNINSYSKAKCRVFASAKTAACNDDLTEQWLQNGQQQLVPTHGLISQPGLFSWDQPDRGSILLLEQLPPLNGTGMDLCSGYGLLSASVLQSSESIHQLHLVEADLFALNCAEKNCSQHATKTALHWLDATTDKLPAKLDWVICNPPFHTGHYLDVELGKNIILNGCKSLKPGGTIYLVANRKLPYEHLLRSTLKNTETVLQADGYKVIKGTR